ncbi:Alpha/Beta hydrolase protein [Mucor mucedo]|uniref:Alpha/Beta hydrolase protein n=1 Tax=Mucor mucedo TaxID=29922 RepID=UPI00221FAFD3|nr:Alpha/Beta hydrolase protein [Mucor mucedo]KAI7891851.1 Alpha/Beta hydrolase protein [Mucor mucedo]
MTEQYLEVKGAKIFYEVEGNGPYILFVPGANGDHRVFVRIRKLLVRYFTVVLYDRRGYSCSKIIGPQDYSNNVETNTEDIHTLMNHLTDESFSIFGISGAGSIIFNYLNTYPGTVRTVFAHEPLTFLNIFPNVKEVQGFYNALYRVFHKEGKNAAVIIYGKKFFNALDHNLFVRNLNEDEKVKTNWDYFFEHEFCEDPFVCVDLDLLRTHKEKLIFLHGEESIGYLCYEPGAFIAKELGEETIQFPGGHNGFYTHSKAFEISFIKLCQEISLVEYHPKI